MCIQSHAFPSHDTLFSTLLSMALHAGGSECSTECRQVLQSDQRRPTERSYHYGKCVQGTGYALSLSTSDHICLSLHAWGEPITSLPACRSISVTLPHSLRCHDRPLTPGTADSCI